MNYGAIPIINRGTGGLYFEEIFYLWLHNIDIVILANHLMKTTSEMHY